MAALTDRILLHLRDGRRVPVDPQEIYLLEADGGETLVRTRSARPTVDVRQISEIVAVVERHGFAHVHRSWAVNLRRVREIRADDDGGWEIRLDPPVNRIIPVSRRRVTALWKRFGE